MSEIILNIEGVELIDLFGEKNKHLNLLKAAYPEVTFTSRGHALKLVGEKKFTQKVKSKIELMIKLIKADHDVNTQVIEDLINGENPFDHKPANGAGGHVIVYGRSGQPIKAKTQNQKVLVDTVERNDIVFAVGPAGTGKTYTAVALAVRALKNKLVKKIILTRPAVEAGESLGFLPGDLKEKVDPYLRPLYDALDDMFPPDKLAHFMSNRIIEIAPLAFMRGRTLDHSFIILDEAQNATSMQLKMFLTRLGPSAQCVITGDLSQVDLPFHQKSGLQQSIDLLSHLDGVGTVYLQAEDVVRHRLVKEIIRAYERSDTFAREERERRRQQKEGFGKIPVIITPEEE
ncbi:MAG: PhoH family protein [Saprospiraceae bacterium]|nr:PhoH family protein [Saprospiraceae bacterium]MCB9314205.1 PhoH family protein [Lewinellaceae bacterium]